MLKYAVLEPFKKYLYENLTKNTARTYYAAIVKFFECVQSLEFEDIIPELILDRAGFFRTRSEFSAMKNGLKWLARYYPAIQLPPDTFFTDISGKKRNYSKKPKKVIYEHPMFRKINQIKNEKLKYAYRLAAVSGLRVSELADLEATDLEFSEGKIFITVRHGKGGHGGKVECQKDPYMYERLQTFVTQSSKEKLFYSESYMRKEADRLGFECHDLRRMFAIHIRNELKKEMPMEQANIVVQQRLRHARFSTTKRYLYNRKLKLEKEFVIALEKRINTPEDDGNTGLVEGGAEAIGK